MPHQIERTPKLEQTLILNVPGNSRHQNIMVHTVKELLQVDIHDIYKAVFDIITGLVYCIVSASARTKPVARF